MKNRQSFVRKFKRQALKDNGKTFAQRTREAIVRGNRVEGIKWAQDKKVEGI